jgi:hypothetical protein
MHMTTFYTPSTSEEQASNKPHLFPTIIRCHYVAHLNHQGGLMMNMHSSAQADSTVGRRFWLAHVRALAESEFSRREYCRRHQLSYDCLVPQQNLWVALGVGRSPSP